LDYKGEVRVDLTRFQPHRLTSHLFADSPGRLADSSLNLSINFKMDGLRNLQAEVQGSIPFLSFQKGNEKVLIRGKSLRGLFHTDDNQIELSLAELNLDYPQLSMSANLLLGRRTPRVRLQLQGRDVDVHSTREVALSLAGDVPGVQQIFEILRGGKVPFIKVESEGSTYAHLRDMENFLIKGRILDGKISVPDAGLDLGDVRGNAVIAKGILEGRRLEARLGKSLGQGGTLKLGLKGGNAPFHLDIMVQGHLPDLPAVLEGVADNEKLLKEIRLIEELNGNASGRLVLGETTESIKVRVDVSKFNLKAKYQRVPFLVKVKGGQFSYDEAEIDVKNLSGRLGKSSFSRLSGQLHWKKIPRFEAKTGNMTIFVDEIYPWLTSFEGFSVHPEQMRASKGTFVLSGLGLRGPLFSPEQWRLETKGEVRNLTMGSSLFPGPIEVSSGSFDAFEDSTLQRLSFRDVRLAVLDASLNLSGVLDDYLRGLKKADVQLNGYVSSESIRWLSNIIHLPPGLRPRAPVSISKGLLVWEKGANASFEGNLVVADGPNVSLDVFRSPKETRIQRLLIQDEESQASLSLGLKEKALSLKFAGNLAKKTSSALLARYEFPSAWIRGDFQAHIRMDRPWGSTAQGKIVGQDLVILRELQEPIRIDNFSLNAKKNKVEVESANFTWGGKNMTLEGEMDFSWAGVVFDMDLTADGLELETIAGLLEENSEKREVKQLEGLWGLPVNGTVRLRSEYLRHEQYTFNPFHADLLFGTDSLSIRVTDASVCGISTPGTIELTPEELSLDFKPVVKNQPLDPTIDCLFGKNEQATGHFDLKMEVQARAKHEALTDSLRGNLEIFAKEGRIHRSEALTKIFSFLNITETFMGKLPDFTKEGFDYNYFTCKGDFEKDKFILKELILDGASMELVGLGDIDLDDKKLDLSMLVAPFKTVDRIMKLPFLKQFSGGSLISIAMKVDGELRNPKISAISPQAVNPELREMMKKSLKRPIIVIDPGLPEYKELPAVTEE
jgi:hypothetical protein